MDSGGILLTLDKVTKRSVQHLTWFRGVLITVYSRPLIISRIPRTSTENPNSLDFRESLTVQVSHMLLVLPLTHTILGSPSTLLIQTDPIDFSEVSPFSWPRRQTSYSLPDPYRSILCSPIFCISVLSGTTQTTHHSPENTRTGSTIPLLPTHMFDSVDLSQDPSRSTSIHHVV